MKRSRCSFAALAFAVAVTAAATARADVKLPAIFGDNMVLQADAKVPVWGKAEPGERIEVRVGIDTAATPDAPNAPNAAPTDAVTQAKQTTADDKGQWKVVLDPLPASDEPIGFVITGKNKVTLENVLVGEVWVASGQSNMEWPVRASNDPEKEIAEAKFPTIRLFQVQKKVAADAPAEDVVGQWVVCGPETVGNFSAVAYFFGREIQNATSRPVGLIGTYWGGTPAESWTSREKLESDEALKPLVTNWDALDKREQEAGENKSRQSPHHPAGLYNGMLAPIVPFAIRGAIWYQGESNAGRAYQYRTLFPAMITDWRERWGQGDFPFLFVQLANFMQRKDQPADSAWAELREAQSLTLDLPNTGQAVIIDIGDVADIHPKNKQDVGKRLALSALAVAYEKEDVVSSGPVFKDVTFEDGKAVLSFDHVGGGLEAKGDALKGFAIAGEDRVFKWADATIEGDTIVVSSPEVKNPTAVRYAWADNPEATLYNAEDLPASPFRTDEWPGVTDDKQ
ncbi:MAG: sialate O-acetylesterase [Planctomycetota bacterium]|nr:sialate O-acetylesterase [Planctomycetaceae bacterium]MDQ3329478.1 sialate O-acetylesterase [Planctomycetota bacterium]